MLFIYLYFTSKINTTEPAVQSGQYLNNYEFLKEDLSKEDKFVMLQAKIFIESYFTCVNSDLIYLEGLKFEVTDSFLPKLNEQINLCNNLGSSSSETTVDTSSIQIESKIDNEVNIQMVANQTMNTKVNKLDLQIDLVKQGDYWLTNNLIIK